ncbi:MAG TPA: 2-amino-4-hydroxy-6-hydroxymethyldihydropteridine diphosphokinase [Deltaproteobacteria bacterium]|nr:2-amino-4-hydroxy-6-hydroxymethyldihydropteridine diphosphokinase [Deltaproteobacteria bacterium]
MGAEQESVVAYVGIGSNLDEPRRNCLTALERIAALPGVSLLRCSSQYLAEPVGVSDQPWFVNAAAEIRTAIDPGMLLSALQRLELDMGRRSGVKWGPRVIDLDILLYGQLVSDSDPIIPHPELHMRRFVLEPLNEIAPWVLHSRFGVTIRGLLDRLDDDKTVEKIGEPPAIGTGSRDKDGGRRILERGQAL